MINIPIKQYAVSSPPDSLGFGTSVMTTEVPQPRTTNNIVIDDTRRAASTTIPELAKYLAEVNNPVSQLILGLQHDSNPLKSRLRATWPSILAEAQQLRVDYPDPVESLVRLLGSIPGDYESWREIIEEPYG